MKKGIILIGPEKAGKTAVGQQLATVLNRPFHDLADDTVQFRTGDTDTENEYFVRHPSNRRLAKQIIYTKEKTPAETCAEIIARLDHTSADVFLLGPVGAGKTTIGRLLA